MFLSLTSNASGASTVVLINDGATTGYDLLQGATFGMATWQTAYSGARGTQGARASSASLPNRVVQLPLRVTGTTKDDLATKVSAIAAAVDQLRRFGGICRMRSKNQTRYQRFEVLTAAFAEIPWENRVELRNRAVVGITLTCGPYILGDPLDFTDAFSVDNVNGGALNYTADAGALTNVTVPGNDGMQGSANLTTENRFIYTGSGYTHGDHEATVKFAPAATITSFKAGVILKWINTSNYLAVYVDDNGTNSRLRIDKVVAGATTNLATTNLGARVVNGTYAWVRGRIEGNTVYAEHFLGTVVPNPIVAPSTSTSINLTTAEAAVFGAGLEGRAGIVFTPQSAGAYIDDFESLPFTYRNPPTYVNDCYGAIPGDAPALADVRLGLPSQLAGVVSPWAMFGWAPRQAVENFVRNGGFETNSTTGWVVSAVTGVTGAASSIAAVVDGTLGVAARYGEYVGQVVTPATANTGASYAIYQRFRAGITYTATIWVRASAGTTTVRARLGVSGDIASSTAVALSTTWTQHTATWTPTTSVDVAYLAVEVTAATGTTFQIDGAAVYRGATAPAIGGQLEGSGGGMPLSVIRAEEGDTNASPARTGDASANGAFLATQTVAGLGSTFNFNAYIDPGLIDPEDYSGGQIALAVFARVRIAVATIAVSGLLRALPDSGAGTVTNYIYTPEFGSTGRPVYLPASGTANYRVTRLGTINLPRVPSGGRWRVSILFNLDGTGTFGLDDVFLMPARSHFIWPTGKATDGTLYPQFLPSTSHTHRTVRSDLSSTMTTGLTSTTAGGVGGALVEIPPGQVSIFGLASDRVPDDPSVAAGTDLQGFPSTHLSLTPRYHWLRPS